MKMKGLVRKAYRLLPFRRRTMHLIRAAYRPASNIYQHLHFRGQFEVPLPDGSRFKLIHFGNQVENDIFWAGFGGAWEATSLRLWIMMARSAAGIIDVGANTGVYALSAQAVAPDARVVAIEPVARIHKRLEQNIAANKFPILALKIAASDVAGEAEIYDTASDHNYSASLNPEMLAHAADRHSYPVATMPIDTIVSARGLGPIDLLKIDVEMHESQVVRGALETIRRYRPAMIIELLRQDSADEISAVLPDYVTFEIEEGHGVRPGPFIVGQDARNWLFLHKDSKHLPRMSGGLAHADIVT